MRTSVRFTVAPYWYLLPLGVVPFLVLAFTPGDLDRAAVGASYLTAFIPALAFQFLSTNWWDEIVWLGFFQLPLQDRYGPMKAVLTTPFFALEHVSLMFDGSFTDGALKFALLTALMIPTRALFAWVFNRTGSIAVAGLTHAATNAAAFGMVPALTHQTGDSGLTLLVLGLVVIVATRGRLGVQHFRRVTNL